MCFELHYDYGGGGADFISHQGQLYRWKTERNPQDLTDDSLGSLDISLNEKSQVPGWIWFHSKN
jgi:hypothetical protein